MLWSLIKILLFVAVIALLAIGAGQLMETGGGVQITVAGTEYTLSPLQSVMMLGALVVLIWVALKLLSLLVAVLKFLSGDETALSRYFDRGRERKGYKALSEGMMALASGEARVAMAKAAKARKLLGKPELTNLLIAQAAEMAGDTKKAAETYKQLIRDDATRFVGVRGIMKQKLAEGDTETAHKLARKAFELKPKHAETQDVLLKLQAGAGDWAGARGTLSAKLKSGTLPRDVYTRRAAVLALSEARDIVDDTASVETREAAIQANRLSPDLIPAAVMAARSYIARGKPRNAVRVLKKAWEVQPHPDLAAAFAEIRPDETPAERLKRFTALTKIHPQNPETRLVLAELLIVAEDFPEARRVLNGLIEDNPDTRALTLMAAAERGGGASDSVVQGWLARALSAPRGPQWICQNCHHPHAEWAPICENCASFDTLGWETPAQLEITSTTGANMLPLIVGAKPGTVPDGDVPVAELLDPDPAAPVPEHDPDHDADHDPDHDAAEKGDANPSPQ